MSEQTIWVECDEAHELAHGRRCAHGWTDGRHMAPVGAVLIERPEALRGPILDLIANELLTYETAAGEIVRLLVRKSTGHTHWFVDTAHGERCEKCGVPRAVVALAAAEGRETP